MMYNCCSELFKNRIWSDYLKTIVKANAKINLFLDILKKNNNGYHNVEMVMQSISLHDIVEISITNNQKISVCSDYCFDIEEQDNLAFKSAKLFFEELKIKNPGVKIKIKKGIPVCAGLAGGSADAAAVLVGLNKLLDKKIPLVELSEISKKIGADVPFCLNGGTKIATGIGTDLRPIHSLPKCYIVVVKPDIDISTKIAYEKSDQYDTKNRCQVQNIVSAIGSCDLRKICSQLYNRFEEVLNIDEVKNIKSQMLNSGALGASMSGSGPTVYGIFQTDSQAKSCLELLKEKYSQTFLCTPENLGCSIIKIKK